MELATGYFGRGQMTTALDEVKLALIADPTSSEAYNLRGLIYANLGDDNLAEESFKRALQLNAGAVILAHNHPSGVAEPSSTSCNALKSALQLVDVRVLDHLVVGQGSVVSFAERGLL